jgi:hypothetical protein
MKKQCLYSFDDFLIDAREQIRQDVDCFADTLDANYENDAIDLAQLAQANCDCVNCTS